MGAPGANAIPELGGRESLKGKACVSGKGRWGVVPGRELEGKLSGPWAGECLVKSLFVGTQETQ